MAYGSRSNFFTGDPQEASASLAQETANAEATRSWLKANAIRLNTVEAGNGFADMQPLKKIIGDARIVALGEATHGSREFFQLKHRMLEFLATEEGFTIFSIEANMPEAYRLNDYVLNGNGDPAKLIAGMYFWTWNTQEVLDMVLWMREFNKSGKGRVQFTGFDMQTPNVAADIVRDFVDKNDPDYADALRKASDVARAAPQRLFRFRPQQANASAIAAISRQKTLAEAGPDSGGVWTATRAYLLLTTCKTAARREPWTGSDMKSIFQLQPARRI